MRRLLCATLLGAFGLAACKPAAPATTPGSPATAEPVAESPRGADPAGPERTPDDLSPIVARARKAAKVPGMGAAIIDADGVAAIGVDGLRRADQEGALQTGDKFHLGSDTKAMTAFMVARLIERRVLSWDTTLGEALPEAQSWMHESYRSVTISQLLRHRAGMPANALMMPDIAAEVGAAPLDGQRLVLARRVLKQPPLHTPGSQYLYSNLGYIMAALMVESISKTPWETLMRQEVFDPLQMRSCGFGPTAQGTDTSQPWGHTLDESGYTPTELDNPPFHGPASRVHCSLADWGRFAAAQFDRGEGSAVSPTTLDRLHAAVPFGDKPGGYALGWIVLEMPPFEGPLLNHDGSNTANYASAFIIPSLGVAVLVVCNAGGPEAQKATVGLVLELLRVIRDQRRTTL